MSDELRRILKQQMQSLIPTSVVMCQVKEVNETDLTITVIQQDNDTDLYYVRLVPAEAKANTVVCIPKVGSLALVGFISNMISASYMIMCQECDKVIINGGDFGGLIKIQELQKQMKKDSDILQALLDVIKGAPMIQTGGSPSVLQAALKLKMATLLIGNYTDIENKNVTHG